MSHGSLRDHAAGREDSLRPHLPLLLAAALVAAVTVLELIWG